MNKKETESPLLVGDVVFRVPITFGEFNDRHNTRESGRKQMRGTVVYMHPKRRFHVVEFTNGIRESFLGTAEEKELEVDN